jgi:membrane protein DedA with SNARE-associated domain
MITDTWRWNMDLSFYGIDLTIWLMNYGSFALFFLLGMGIFGLPVPEETLLTLAGIFIRSGDLAFVPAILAAYLGTVCGITISYLLGRTAGHSLITKYGKWLHLKSQDTPDWFMQFSKWTLLVGYLIPGLRHFTGLFAGTAAMHFKKFAQFAYSGALLWVLLYLSIGYFWGHWFTTYATFLQNLELAMDLFTLGLVLIFVAYVIYQQKIKKRS